MRWSLGMLKTDFFVDERIHEAFWIGLLLVLKNLRRNHFQIVVRCFPNLGDNVIDPRNAWKMLSMSISYKQSASSSSMSFSKF